LPPNVFGELAGQVFPDKLYSMIRWLSLSSLFQEEVKNREKGERMERPIVTIYSFQVTESFLCNLMYNPSLGDDLSIVLSLEKR
jgi:hypothetical protein